MFVRSMRGESGQGPSASALVFFTAVAILCVGGRPGHGAVVGEEARTRAKRQERIPVLVVMRGPAGAGSDRKQGHRRAAIAQTRASVLAGSSKAEVEIRRAYEVLPGFEAMVTSSGLARLSAQADVLRIDVDAEGGGALAFSVPQIEADRVHARGIGGAGTVIAVLDTGVDSDHPDLADAIVGEECFCSSSCCPNGTSRQSGPGGAESSHDHGVHVSGIAVSRGRLSAPGVAPEAHLLAIRVLNDSNRGFLSDWIAALDWIAANRPDVRVVNMSLVSDTLYAGDCDHTDATNMLFAEAIDLLYQQGTLVFVASGNNAQSERLTSPACIRNAVSVGAVTREDEVWFVGNSGPNLDLLAPGVGIVSDAVDGLTTLSGTSMATPHAAGTAALLISALPGASAPTIEAAMIASGLPITDLRNGKVTPRVNALGALVTLDESAALLRGGGSETTDCLLEWNFMPPGMAREFPRGTAYCTDGDGECDADDTDGQCTFEVSLCFNMPDPRLPACGSEEELSWYEATLNPAMVCVGDCNRDFTVNVDEMVQAVAMAFGTEPVATCPAADAGGDGLVEANDLVTIVGNALEGCSSMRDLNAYTLPDLLPSFPVTGQSMCSVPVPIIVMRPPGTRGVGAIRMSVYSPTRRDYDRISLVCEP